MTDQPLLMPLAPQEWGEDEYAAVGALMGIPGDQVPRAGSGDPRDPSRFDILGVLARHPKLARKFLIFNAYLLQDGELPARLRELAVLRLAYARRSVFFWAEHVRIARVSGLSDDEIARIACGNSGFDGVDRLVLEATDTVLTTGRATPQQWRTLVDELGTHQAMELLFVIGTYGMLASACDTWQLRPPPDSPELPD